MSTGLDTSVALRLLTGVPADQAEHARELVARAPSPVTISDLVVAETYFALRHHYAVPHAAAVRALGALLADGRVRGSGVAASVLFELASAGEKPRPGLVDRLIHADYRRDRLDVATFDRDLGRLPGTRVLGSS